MLSHTTSCVDVHFWRTTWPSAQDEQGAQLDESYRLEKVFPRQRMQVNIAFGSMCPPQACDNPCPLGHVPQSSHEVVPSARTTMNWLSRHFLAGSVAYKGKRDIRCYSTQTKHLISLYRKNVSENSP